MPSVDAAYKEFFSKVSRCTTCVKQCVAVRKLVDAGKPFIPLPNLDPYPRLKSSGVTFLFVAMEPTTNQWVKDERMATAKRLVQDGMRNHGPSALHIAARERLLRPGESYLLTDAAKCALPAKGAKTSRRDRMNNCRDHLAKEVEILRPKVLVAIGGATEKWLRRVAKEVELPGGAKWPEVVRITHFSGQSIGPAAAKLAKRQKGLRLPSRETLRKKFDQIHREQGLPAAYERRGPHPKQDANTVAVYREEFRKLRAALRRVRS